MNITQLLKSIFNDDRFIQKAGVIIGINFVLSFLTFFINSIFQFSSLILEFVPISFGKVSSDQITAILNSPVTMIVTLVVSIATLPFWIYQKGYIFNISDRVRKNKTEPLLPEHGKFKKLSNIGGAFISIRYTLEIPFIIMSAILLLGGFPLITGQFSSGRPTIGMIGIVWIIVSVILISLIISILDSFVVPNLMYIYFKSGSLQSIFDIKTTWKVITESIKTSWQEWFIYFVVSIGLNLVRTGINIFSCLTCIGILIIPVVNTLSEFIKSAILGNIYYNMDRS